METFKQLLHIPENHQLHFDVKLPDSFPPGPAEVVLVFSSKIKSAIQATEIQLDELLKLAGSLKDSPRFGGDSLAIQKAIRDEWKR